MRARCSSGWAGFRPSIALLFAPLVLAACSDDHRSDPASPLAPSSPESETAPEQIGPSVVDVAYAESSQPLRELVAQAAKARRESRDRDRDDERAREHEEAERERDEAHPVGKIRPLPQRAAPFTGDSVLQSSLPLASMPVVGVNFLSQGNTLDPATE